MWPMLWLRRSQVIPSLISYFMLYFNWLVIRAIAIGFLTTSDNSLMEDFKDDVIKPFTLYNVGLQI